MKSRISARLHAPLIVAASYPTICLHPCVSRPRIPQGPPLIASHVEQRTRLPQLDRVWVDFHRDLGSEPDIRPCIH